MAATVSYNALASELEKELTITISTYEDPTRFKRKLSQAKHRMAIDGKLIFSVLSIPVEDGKVIHTISVALAPKRSTVALISMDKKAGL